MLTQYRLELHPDRPCRPRAEWGYRLYAALLEQMPAAFGTAAHQDGRTPISQHLTAGDGALRWTVSLLGTACEAAASGALERLDRICLEKDGILLTVRNRQRSSVADVEALLTLASCESGLHTLGFRTATAFKSRGQYLNLPSARLIVQSLIQKWNGCIAECPIEDEDGQGTDALAAGLQLRSFRLQDRVYHLKGSPVPGFVGELTLENCLQGFPRQLADALLVFAEYAGVGIKTTLGMGGVERLNR